MSHDLGVVVLGYGLDAGGEVDRLLANLRAEGVMPEQVTIVWNPSASGPAVGSTIDGVSTIIPQQNLGYAGGMNLGIREQLERHPRLILLLTMDVRLSPGSVARLCQAASAAPRYGVLGPVTRHLPDLTFWGLRWSRSGVTTPILAAPDDKDGDGVVECDTIDGAAFLITSEVLRKVGSFLDRFFMYYEETEFCLRVKRAGWGVGVVLDALAEHHAGGSRRPGAYQYLTARNGLEFARLLSGRRGVAGAIYRYVKESVNLMAIQLNPRSDRSHRRLAHVRLTTLWLGTLAFSRRRWGPPPAGLPGVGDITLSQ
jgi:GT2 family glycosyltransferase